MFVSLPNDLDPVAFGPGSTVTIEVRKGLVVGLESLCVPVHTCTVSTQQAGAVQVLLLLLSVLAGSSLLLLLLSCYHSMLHHRAWQLSILPSAQP